MDRDVNLIDQSDEYLNALDSLWKHLGYNSDHPLYQLFLGFVDTARPVAADGVVDPQAALVGSAFLTVLRDPSVVWRDRQEVAEFIKRVAETCAQQHPTVEFKSALATSSGVSKNAM